MEQQTIRPGYTGGQTPAAQLSKGTFSPILCVLGIIVVLAFLLLAGATYNAPRGTMLYPLKQSAYHTFGQEVPVREPHQNWSQNGYGGGLSSPLVNGNLVYIGCPDNHVRALTIDDGTEEWSFATKANVISSPVYDNGKIFVGCNDHNIYALKAETGALEWEYSTNGAVQSSPCVADGLVFVGSDDGTLYALNQVNGSLLWEFSTGAAVKSSPVVFNNTVYFGNNGGFLFALSASKGAKLWEYEAGSAIGTRVAVENDTLFAGTEDGTVLAINADTGGEQWSCTGFRKVCSGLTATDGRLYFGTTQSVCAVDTSDGTVVWRYDIGYEVYSTPCVFGGYVYVGHDGCAVLGLDATTGELCWRYHTYGRGVRSSPAVDNDTLYIANDNSELFSLNLSGG